MHIGALFGNNSGTDMLEQPARSLASCMVILIHRRRNSQLFRPFPLPAHLSHGRSRGFESLASKAARQVHLNTHMDGGLFYLMPTYRGYRIDAGV
jgi:hypothetical protein